MNSIKQKKSKKKKRRLIVLGAARDDTILEIEQDQIALEEDEDPFSE